MKVERVMEEMKKSVEKNLVKICKDLLNAWDERQTETGLQKASMRAFGSSLVPEEGKLEEFYRNSENVLQDVVEKIPGKHGKKYQPSEMVDGFVAWNKYFNDSDKSIPMNKSWRQWISKLTKEDKHDDYSLFVEFFELVEIRSMSEAMAEMVGSIMNINNGTGRQLQPVNFSTEICLRFNLGPLHTLTGLIQDVVKEHSKDFFRKHHQRA